MVHSRHASGNVIHETNHEVEGVYTVQKQNPYKYKIIWKSVISSLYLHAATLYAIYLSFTSAKFLTILQALIFAEIGILGVTCGAHRLWSHRSYKVNTPLKTLMLAMQTLAFQYSAITWAQFHRVHHKFSDTDADPHNANRGFFFAHIGWLLTTSHPDFEAKKKDIDISDLMNDPLVKFQHEYFEPLVMVMAFLLPIALPMYFWNESFTNAWHLNILRFCLTLHSIWLINSAAHIFGNKPYDRFINPSENITTSVLALGEGWHNYHHAFPWDYNASELGKYSINFSSRFIDLFGKIGWAYDLKSVSEEMIRKRVIKTGDGTHKVWGWSDSDMLKEDIQDTVISNIKEMQLLRR